MKSSIFLFCLMLAAVSLKSQNITNTLGNLGNFTIKDASNTYFSMSQSSGNLTLNRGLILQYTTNSTNGIIFKGGASFIHDYFPPGAFGDNVFVGHDAGNFTMTGSSLNSSFNTSVGSLSLTALTTGANNSGFGYSSLVDNTSGNSNSAFGHSSLGNNSTGSFNSAFGFESLFKSTTVSSSSAFGYQSLREITTGNQNSAFGTQSMFNTNTGSSNSSFGFQSSFSNTFASNCSSFGFQSLFTNKGARNNGFGYQSMYFNNGGVDNCAFGYQALYNSVSGSLNTAIGNSSLINNTGTSNTALGEDAGTNVTSGSNLTLIGYNSEPTSGTAINQVTLGNSSVTSLRCAVTTITSLSDERDKKNIHNLELGLDFIAKLKPRIYNWDKREWYENNISDGSKMQETQTAGFIAQELDEVQTTQDAQWLNLVLKDNPEKWEATPGNLLPVMVKAIQELSDKCDSLKKENDNLSAKLSEVNDLKVKLELLSTQIENLNPKTDELKKSRGNIKSSENNLHFISNENTK